MTYIGREFEAPDTLYHTDPFGVILTTHHGNFQFATDLCYLCENGSETDVSDSWFVLLLVDPYYNDDDLVEGVTQGKGLSIDPMDWT